MIETHDLGKQFDGFQAVDGITLQVGAGEVLALLGPNGAGKTTTVRMLTSVLRPSRGWARVADYDVVAQAPQVRASVGVLTEQHGLYGRMPADEYLDFFGQIYGLEANRRRRRIEALTAQFGLGSFLRRRTGEYSKGMRQKLALARALLHEPPVLLLDEPTSAMDPESARLVRDAIQDLRSNDRAIVICTHNLAEAEELADQIAIIRSGRIIVRGTPAALKNNLLGPEEYEVRLGSTLNGFSLALPPQARLTQRGEAWFRYQTSQPGLVNPFILQNLVAQNLPVLALFPIPRSLEQVYLQAIATLEGREARHVG
jgi:ABC-2 type transport system ATP-binding protein